jgi:hypothetical protein
VLCHHVAVINGSSAVAAAFEIHWGNLGSFIGGGAALLLAVVAIVTGTAGLKDWRAHQRQQQELAKEQTKNILLNRRRVLQGWSPHGVATYGVQLVTDSDEMKNAVEQLIAREPSEYVVLRVAESGSNVNRAYDLRNLIETGGYLSRPPSAGEREALEVGRQHLPATDDAGYLQRGE